MVSIFGQVICLALTQNSRSEPAPSYMFILFCLPKIKQTSLSIAFFGDSLFIDTVFTVTTLSGWMVNYSLLFFMLQGESAEGDAEPPEFLECVLSDKEANISPQSKLFCYIAKHLIHCSK